MWADSMAALAGCWCRHASADRHLRTVFQKLEPLRLLSSKQVADINTCYTTLLVSTYAQTLCLSHIGSMMENRGNLQRTVATASFVHCLMHQHKLAYAYIHGDIQQLLPFLRSLWKVAPSCF